MKARDKDLKKVKNALMPYLLADDKFIIIWKILIITIVIQMLLFLWITISWNLAVNWIVVISYLEINEESQYAWMSKNT